LEEIAVYEPYLSALADLFYPSAASAVSGGRATYSAALASMHSPVWAAPSVGVVGCKNVDFGFQSASAPLKYDGVGKQVVHALKYRGYKRVVGRLAAPLMLQVVGEGHFDAVVPVPLHSSRLRKRGFNQAELLARGVAEKMKATVSDTLEVVRSTRDQVELSAAQRRANVAGAYTATKPLRGKILLIDDVFTTGATMSACAGTLVRAGAEEVHALSLCRTC
jgi:competence protein ComFC